MSLGPFDLAGGPFLTLYGVLLGLAVLAGFAIPRWLRPTGRSVRGVDPDAIAYLAGGSTRFVDALVARLLARRAMILEGKDEFRIVGDAAASQAERGVLALSSPARWKAIQLAAAREAPAVEQRLVQDDLLIDAAPTLQLRVWQTSPYFLLCVFGAIKWDIGTMRDRPVGYLTALLILTAVLALIRFAVVDRRTRGGLDLLGEQRANATRLRRAPVAEETGLAVALFGTMVLSGSAWGEYHKLRTAGGGDGGFTSDGGSGCGGGGDGGGGGCGGCGS